MISHKIWEIWENITISLIEMGGHMTLEWDLIKMEMMLSFSCACTIFSTLRNDMKYYQVIEETKSFPTVQAASKSNHY